MALAREDKKIVLIVCDVGFSFIEEFAKEFPKQYINAGVTEQSATGMAAGLALMGYKPYYYSMIPFVTMRNFEQLRNDICYNSVDVKLIGVRGSEHYKFLGFSHNISEDEDIKILSHLPNLTTHVCTTDEELSQTMMEEYKRGLPSYFRI